MMLVDLFSNLYSVDLQFSMISYIVVQQSPSDANNDTPAAKQ